MTADGVRYTVLVPAGDGLEPLCGFKQGIGSCRSLLRSLFEAGDDRIRRAEPSDVLIVACRDNMEILAGTRMGQFFKGAIPLGVFHDLVESNKVNVVGTGAEFFPS